MATGKTNRRWRKRYRARMLAGGDRADNFTLDRILGQGPAQPGVMNLWLIRRAIIQKWPVAIQKRSQLIKHLVRVVECPDADPKCRVVAAQCLALCDEANVT